MVDLRLGIKLSTSLCFTLFSYILPFSHEINTILKLMSQLLTLISLLRLNVLTNFTSNESLIYQDLRICNFNIFFYFLPFSHKTDQFETLSLILSL